MPTHALTAERSLELPHRMTTTLAGAITTDEVASAIFAMTAVDLGAGSTGLWLRDDGETHLALVGQIGFAGSVSGSFVRRPRASSPACPRRRDAGGRRLGGPNRA